MPNGTVTLTDMIKKHDEEKLLVPKTSRGEAQVTMCYSVALLLNHEADDDDSAEIVSVLYQTMSEKVARFVAYCIATGTATQVGIVQPDVGDRILGVLKADKNAQGFVSPGVLVCQLSEDFPSSFSVLVTTSVGTGLSASSSFGIFFASVPDRHVLDAAVDELMQYNPGKQLTHEWVEGLLSREETSFLSEMQNISPVDDTGGKKRKSQVEGPYMMTADDLDITTSTEAELEISDALIPDDKKQKDADVYCSMMMERFDKMSKRAVQESQKKGSEHTDKILNILMHCVNKNPKEDPGVYYFCRVEDGTEHWYAAWGVTPLARKLYHRKGGICVASPW